MFRLQGAATELVRRGAEASSFVGKCLVEAVEDGVGAEAAAVVDLFRKTASIYNVRNVKVF